MDEVELAEVLEIAHYVTEWFTRREVPVPEEFRCPLPGIARLLNKPLSSWLNEICRVVYNLRQPIMTVVADLSVDDRFLWGQALMIAECVCDRAGYATDRESSDPSPVHQFAWDCAMEAARDDLNEAFGTSAMGLDEGFDYAVRKKTAEQLIDGIVDALKDDNGPLNRFATVRKYVDELERRALAHVRLENDSKAKQA